MTSQAQRADNSLQSPPNDWPVGPETQLSGRLNSSQKKNASTFAEQVTGHPEHNHRETTLDNKCIIRCAHIDLIKSLCAAWFAAKPDHTEPLTVQLN